MGLLSEKTIVVTGASQGLGLAMARGCAQVGATVVLVARTESKLRMKCNELIESGLRCEAIVADVTQEKDVENLFKKVFIKYGKLDGLINNAGITNKVKFLESTLEDYENVVDSNLKSVYLCSRAAAKIMVTQKSGSIVNISSVAAKNGGGLMSTSLYAAGKGGVISFTKGIARELAPYNVRVNVICPACIDTPATTVNRDPEEYEKSIEKIPLHRRGEPNDVVGAAVLLLSDYSSFMVGSSVDINGGVYF